MTRGERSCSPVSQPPGTGALGPGRVSMQRGFPGAVAGGPRARWRAGLAVLLAGWLLGGCSEPRYLHEDGGLVIREGLFRQQILPYGRPVEEVFRTVGFELPVSSSASYVSAFLTGIPLELMPEDRPFALQDLQRMQTVCFVVPDADVRGRVKEIVEGPNLGWRKIRFRGWELVAPGADVRGEDGRVDGCPLVALEEIDVFYGSVADLPAGWMGAGEERLERVERVDRPATPRVPVTDAGFEIQMVEVAGGTFLAWEQPEEPVAPPTVVVRGRDGSVREVVEEDEDPPTPRWVTVADFAIGAREVTRELWSQVMGMPAPGTGGPNHPATGVTYRQVGEFIRRLNAITGESYRLPTEYEWEYAARGGGLRRTWAGTSDAERLYDYAWLDRNSGCRPQPVGRLRPNELGLYDMTGNVWEYCLDLSDAEEWAALPARVRAVLREIPGAESAYGRPFRPLRGGGCCNGPYGSRICVASSTFASEGGDEWTGFRLAR